MDTNGPTRSSHEEEAYDVVVVGSGAGGLVAALVSAIAGMRTLVVEKSDQVGGTTAYSSGTVWIPNNPDQRRAGITNDDELALQYLDALVGDRSAKDLRRAFVAAGPEMLGHLASHTDIRFRPYPQQPDYWPGLPGAAPGYRSLEPTPFDGRTLGPRFARVRAPIRELMLFGGMMVTRGEASRLLRIGRSPDAFRLGASLVARFVLDRLRFPRGTRLVLGNALVARLYRNLVDRRVPVWLDARAVALISEHGRVRGVVVDRAGSSVRVGASRGVVLAGGGFPASADRRARYLPTPVPMYTAAFAGSTGDTLAMAQEIGAALGQGGRDNAFWFPSSIAKRTDGSTAVYPHIVLDRPKPGLIAVNSAGRRFVDEAAPYHEFTRAMYESEASVPSIPAWLVCDRRFVRKYGLGMIRPLTPFLGGYVKRGYLKTGRTIVELATAIGVDAAGLVETVARHNEAAATGVDTEFGKGGNAYDRHGGDPTHRPNPCIGRIEQPPFCAVAVYPTPLGTSLGLATDEHGQVLDDRGSPIQGLYACGNDSQSVFGGEYPGAGAQLGVAMTFGYLAAMHAIRAAAEREVDDGATG